MSVPNPQQQLRQRKNERFVTDPITHLPLLVHDHQDDDIDTVSIHPAKSNDIHSPEFYATHPVNNDDLKSTVLERVVNEELQRGRWRVQGESEITSRTKVHAALIALGVIGFGGPLGLIWLWVLSWMLGRSKFGFVELVLGIWGSLGLALVVAVCLVFVPFELVWRFCDEQVVWMLEKLLTQPNANAFKTEPSTSTNASNIPNTPPRPVPIPNPESALWINSLLHTLWPIINPTIFVSFSDLFEDALHRSLPKFIHGVRVADIGQGSEPMRILGIQWLHPSSSSTSLQQGSDFFNVEVALAYRARKIDKKLRDKAENAHIFLEFLLPGGILFPVFIELTGLLSTARLRIQLTPNPPFFSLTTLTLLGQPKIDFVCTPLSRSFFPNLMDIPGLSGWLKREIENVVSEYVAPRSLTLDLGAMVGGKGERRDTDSEGVIVVVVRRAKGFRCGDAGHVWQSKEKRMGDLYVKVGWGKWGKALWSTRIIRSQAVPVWEETTALLVGPSEINAHENIRLQLWDSDIVTSDNLLGTVEFPLKEIMENSLNHFTNREDPFMDPSPSPNSTTGTLSWTYGYFPKTTFEQHLQGSGGSENDVKEIVRRIEREVEDEIRREEARKANFGFGLGFLSGLGLGSNFDVDGMGVGNGTGDKDKDKDKDKEERERERAKEKEKEKSIEEMKTKALEEKEEEIIAGREPMDDEWPSGILKLRIESISGLELDSPGREKTGKMEVQEGRFQSEGDQEAQGGGGGGGEGGGGGGDLPSSYCEVMVNHQRVYRTRTKIKSSNPFFNATTEKFIRDLRSTILTISIRDSKIHKNNPLLGILVLPLKTLFSQRRSSYISDTFPLIRAGGGGGGGGGGGAGRMRLTLVWRSVQLKLPMRSLGWNVGTLDIWPRITIVSDSVGGAAGLPPDVVACKVQLRTRDSNVMGEMEGCPDFEGGGWAPKTKNRLGHPQAHNIRLPITWRFASCLVIEFKKHKHKSTMRELVSSATGSGGGGGTEGSGSGSGSGSAGRSLAYAVLWLRDLVDGLEGDVKLDVRRNERGAMERAEVCCYRGDVDVAGQGAAQLEGEGETESEMEKDLGEKIGEITLRLKFWPGLSGYHRDAAVDRDGHLADVLEVLECEERERYGEVDSRDGGKGHLVYEEDEGDAEGDNASINTTISEISSSSSPPSVYQQQQQTRTESSFFGLKKGQGQGDVKRRHQIHRLRDLGREIEHVAEKAGAKIVGALKHHGEGHDIGIEKEV